MKQFNMRSDIFAILHEVMFKLFYKCKKHFLTSFVTWDDMY